MTVRFELREFGTSFATRGRGEELRNEVMEHVDDSGHIVVDLAGVEHVSYSFADELLGKLATASSVSVDIEGAGPTVSRTIEDAIRRRSAPVSC